MALQVWLPLNGNVNNQGLSDLTFSVSSVTTINDNGKIGKCYENNSFTAGGLFSDKIIDLGQNQSMFCWFKINSLRSNSSLGGGLVTQHNHTLNQGMGITIRYVSATTGYLSVSTGNGTSRTYNTYYGKTLLQAGTWYHGGYTYDGTTIRLYVNGSLDGEFERSDMKIEPDNIHIFRWTLLSGSYSFDGCLNDVRIYDDVLSPREIKEISKALLLHYTLSSAGGENLCVGSNNISTSNFVLTRSTAEGNTVTLTPTTSASYVKYKASNLLYSDYKNKTYTLSFYIRRMSSENESYTDKQLNIYIGLNIPARINNVISSSYDKYVLVDSLKDIPNDWEYHSVTCTVPDDLKSGKDDAIADTSMVTFQFTNAASGTPVQIKSIKFEIGDKATPWVPNSADLEYATMGYDDNIEYDVSGYGYNGIHNNITWSGDSPRYNGCYELNGTNSYIRIDSGNWKVMGAEELTVNEWAYADDWATQTNAHLWSCTESGGFNTENGETGKLRFPVHVYTNAEKTTHDYINVGSDESIIGTARVGTATIANNVVGFVISDLAPGWHMFTGVYNTSGIKTYIDGVLKESANCTSYGIYYSNATLFLGAESTGVVSCKDPYFNGKLSDFRMYYTALTADEVMELYHVGASLSNNGVLMAYEFIE